MSYPVGLTFCYVLLLLAFSLSPSLYPSFPPSLLLSLSSHPESAVQVLLMIENTLCYRSFRLCARENTHSYKQFI